MILEQIHIGAFGKLEDFSVTLTQGFQVVYGENEAGKTTLMTFLSMMFYSQQEAARALERNPRGKYQPWSGKPMEGAIIFSWKGERYHLSKQFGRIPSQDIVQLTKPATGEVVPLEQGQEVGEYFFDINLSAFQRSSFIGQLGIIDTGKGTDDIAEKLVQNLWETGDRDISQQKVHQRLEDAKYQLVSRSGTLGILVEEKAKLQETKDLRERVRYQRERQQDTRREYQALEEKYKESLRIKESIQGYHSVEQQQRLKALLADLEQRQALGESLFLEPYTEDTLAILLGELRDNERGQEQLLQGMESLKQSLETSGTVLISSQEAEAFERCTTALDDAQKAQEHWESRVRPAMEQRLSLLEEREALRPALAQAQHQKETIRAALALQEKQEVYTEQRHSLAQQERLWEEREQLWQEQLTALEEKAVLQQKKKIHPILLVVGILFTLLSLGAGFMLTPLAYLGAGVGLTFVLLAFLVGKTQKLPPGELPALQQWEAEKKDYTQWQKEKSQQRELWEQQLAALQEENYQLQQWLEDTEGGPFDFSVSELALHQEDVETQYQKLAQKQQQIHHKLEGESHYLRQMLVPLFGETPEEISLPKKREQLEWYAIQYQEPLQKYREHQKQWLQEKGAATPEEYRELYHTSRVRQGTLKDIGQRQAQVQQLQADFVERLSHHTPTESYDEALKTLGRLEHELTRYRSLHQQCLTTAQSLGFSKVSLGIVRRKIQDLIPETKAYTDLPQSPTLEALEQRLEELSGVDYLSQLQSLQQDLIPPKRSLESIEREILALEKSVAEKERYHQALTLDLDTLEDAQEEMRKSFGPVLNQTAGDILSQITGERYQTLAVDKSYDVQVKQGLHYRPWAYLSHGTVDQAYLALRLAIAQCIAPKEGVLPLLLDDIFIQYDDKRARRTLEFLKEYSHTQGAQTVLFTCHRRMVEYAKERQVPTAVLP